MTFFLSQQTVSNNFIRQYKASLEWGPSKKVRLYEGDYVTVSVDVRSLDNVNKGDVLLVTTLQDQFGKAAYPLSDPNYSWHAKRYEGVASSDWNTITIEFPVGHNYNSDEIY